ncbi:hypothetical protein [Pseudomonas sp.]|uniref:DUF6957 family protein n=1 Tax=Pseudomonas sp. TaxID=306 RepID=UPI0024885508|nr:hypothetical protein [Pseudomonas sp.]MDI1328911.1 hypothetical protein [Pseudomonas sp.]
MKIDLVGMWMDEVAIGAELLSGLGDAREGAAFTTEFMMDAIQDRFPGKAYCLVEEWIIFRADLSHDELTKVNEAGHIPLFVFAHRVVQDSRRRFQMGDWVRSSMCVTFREGYMFETKNTVYLLMGNGEERVASLNAIFSFF